MNITINVIWIIILIATTVINIISHIAMKFNDMRHLKKDIERIYQRLDKLEEETNKQRERLSHIEGFICRNGGKK